MADIFAGSVTNISGGRTEKTQKIGRNHLPPQKRSETRRRMKKYFYGKGVLLLFWVCGFLTGVGGMGNPAKAEKYRVYAVETSEMAEKSSRLEVVFFDDKGRKVCVRQDGILQLAEKFCLEIPLQNWEEGQEGLVEIKIFYGDGREEESAVRIKRGETKEFFDFPMKR